MVLRLYTNNNSPRTRADRSKWCTRNWGTNTIANKLKNQTVKVTIGIDEETNDIDNTKKGPILATIYNTNENTSIQIELR